MHSNSITILGVLMSKNVNGEDRSNTRFVYSANNKDEGHGRHFLNKKTIS